MRSPKKARFPHPCNYPGCHTLTKYRFCEDHTPAADENRASASRRGYDARWRKYRKAFLVNNPLCAECMRNNKMNIAIVVDHIKSHKGSYKLFWDESNHEALCKPCHDAKTAREDMASWDTHGGLK